MTFDSFFDRVADLDWLGVVVGAVVFIILGMIWFGPLFGKQWTAATGQPAMDGMPATDKLIAAFAYSFVLSAAVNYFGVIDDFEHAIVTGLLLGVFVIGSATYAAVVWDKMKNAAWMINTLYMLVAIAVVTYVQGLMA